MSGVTRTAWVDRRRLRGFAWSWLAIGLPTGVFGALLLAAAALFQGHAVPVEGVVVRHEGTLGQGGPSRNPGHDREVVPVVRYMVSGGAQHELRGMQVRNERDALPLGRRVPVRYRLLEDGQVSARIDAFGEIWGVPLLFALFGGAFTLCGVIGLRASRNAG